MKKKIVNTLLYAEDMVIYVKKYMEIMEAYDWQDAAEDLQETIDKALRIIDKYKETYIICFDKEQWSFIKRLEKCLKKNVKKGQEKED